MTQFLYLVLKLMYEFDLFNYIILDIQFFVLYANPFQISIYLLLILASDGLTLYVLVFLMMMCLRSPDLSFNINNHYQFMCSVFRVYQRKVHIEDFNSFLKHCNNCNKHCNNVNTKFDEAHINL